MPDSGESGAQWAGYVQYFTPSLNHIGHVSRIYLTTMHVNCISKKNSKDLENPEYRSANFTDVRRGKNIKTELS